MENLTDKSIIITGGGSGIGAGTAAYFVERGAKVTICGRRKQKVESTAEQLGDLCQAVQADITHHDDRARLVEAALNHGEGQLHALVNNAGNMYRGALQDLEEDELSALFNTNVIAAMMLSALCTTHLEATSGAIVFLGSIHNRRAFPGVSPYAATKGAIEALTKSLAAELGPRNIRVNCVAPGAVFSEINQRAGLFSDDEAYARLQSMKHLHALGRIGETDEVAQAIAYFVNANWTTGAVLEVDGGLALGITQG